MPLILTLVVGKKEGGRTSYCLLDRNNVIIHSWVHVTEISDFESSFKNKSGNKLKF